MKLQRWQHLVQLAVGRMKHYLKDAAKDMDQTAFFMVERS